MREQGVKQLFVILGASGSGKSSYLRAGLWPRLGRDDRNFLPLPVVRPERNVITGPTGLVVSLAETFRRLDQKKNRRDLQETLFQPDGLGSLLKELLALAEKRLPDDLSTPTIVLSIDQGEELFSADGRKEADQFLSWLAVVLSSGTSTARAPTGDHCRIIAAIAIRSDSYELLQTASVLSAVRHNPFNLRPLRREEFKAVIEEPAKLVPDGLRIESILTEQLLNDAEGADALPLLAFTLEQLFQKYGADGDLTLEEYNKLGGIRGSIEEAVKVAFRNPDKSPTIPDDEKERDRLLRQTFIPWLASVDPETGLAKRRIAPYRRASQRSTAALGSFDSGETLDPGSRHD
jgi:hypothetical protein